RDRSVYSAIACLCQLCYTVSMKRGETPMVRDRKRLTVSPESELSLVLRSAAADGEPVVIDTGDTVYELAVQPAARPQPTATPTQRPSPEQVARALAGLEQAAGAWDDVDA